VLAYHTTVIPVHKTDKYSKGIAEIKQFVSHRHVTSVSKRCGLSQ